MVKYPRCKVSVMCVGGRQKRHFARESFRAGSSCRKLACRYTSQTDTSQSPTIKLLLQLLFYLIIYFPSQYFTLYDALKSSKICSRESAKVVVGDDRKFKPMY